MKGERRRVHLCYRRMPWKGKDDGGGGVIYPSICITGRKRYSLHAFPQGDSAFSKYFITSRLDEQLGDDRDRGQMGTLQDKLGKGEKKELVYLPVVHKPHTVKMCLTCKIMNL